MDFVELRIHGVSGTPPDDLLASKPVLFERRSSGATRFKPADVDPWAQVYHWSDLTSGNSRSALWVLLIPYMMLNVAGFALAPHPGRRQRVASVLVRLAGVALTAMFTGITASGFIGVGGYGVLRGVWGWSPTASILTGAFVTTILVTGVWIFTSRNSPDVYAKTPFAMTRREFRQARRDGSVETADPAGRIRIEDRAFWEYHPIVDDLRSIHIGVSFLVIAWTLRLAVVESNAGGPVELFGNVAGLLTFVLLPLIALWATVDLSLRSGRRPSFLDDVSVGMPIVAAAALAYHLVWAALVPSCVACAHILNQLDDVVGWLVFFYAILTVAVLVMALGVRENRITAVALMTMAGATGASVGAGAVAASADAFGLRRPGGVVLLAESYLIGLVIIGVVALLVFRAGLKVPLPDGHKEPLKAAMRAVRHVRDHAHIVLGTVVGVTALGVVRFAVEQFTLFQWPSDRIVLIGGMAIIGVLVTEIVFRLAGWKWALAVPAAALAVTMLVRAGYLTAIGPIPLGFTTVTDAAVSVTLILPLAVVLGRVVSGVRKRDDRRATAVAWDVGSFFPRWFHPFAPPSYGPVVVPDLQQVLDEENDQGILLSCHSQGTVIGLAAIASNAPTDRISFLTYGSPIGSLYRRFFPLWFDSDLITHVRTRLGGDGADLRWRNLHRDTDPIGGPIPCGEDRMGPPFIPDADPIDDPRGRIHGFYWVEDAYRTAAAHLLEMVKVGPSEMPESYADPTKHSAG